MTAPTRSSVHRSVAKPFERAPLRSAPSTSLSWADESRALRPRLPLDASAALPPSTQARCQREALWRVTPRARTTSAWLDPRSNIRAARSRRRSREARSWAVSGTPSGRERRFLLGAGAARAMTEFSHKNYSNVTLFRRKSLMGRGALVPASTVADGGGLRAAAG